jgi:hypothetical protein
VSVRLHVRILSPGQEQIEDLFQQYFPRLFKDP